MLRNSFSNRQLLVTAVLCTASLLFFASACNEKLGVVDSEKDFSAAGLYLQEVGNTLEPAVRRKNTIYVFAAHIKTAHKTGTLKK